MKQLVCPMSASGDPSGAAPMEIDCIQKGKGKKRAKAKAQMVKANRREMAKARVRAKIPGGSLGSEKMVRAMAAKRTKCSEVEISKEMCSGREKCSESRDFNRNALRK